MKTLLLIDANSLIHRSFHALPPLTSPDGKPTQAIYGITNVLFKLWREDGPDYAAALFDRPEPTFRKKKFKEYKAHRPPTPNELISQIIEAHQLFKEVGIKTFEKPGYEADDLIATLAEKFGDTKDLRVVVLTGDLDTLQLVRGNKVVVRTFRKGVSDTFIYDEDAVRERYGLGPDRLIDYKALVGDQSDNIPGVPGVGPKTASDLLQRYKTLENVYKHLKEEPKAEKKLASFKKQAELSKILVTLERNAPIEVGGLEELKIPKLNIPTVYFERMGFGTILKRIREAEAPQPTSVQGSIFEGSTKEDVLEAPEDTVIVKMGDAYKKEFASKKTKIGFDLKSELKRFLRNGKDLFPPYFDLGVAFWLIDSSLKDYGPERISETFLRRTWSSESSNYIRAFEFAEKKLNELNLVKIFKEMEMPLLRILAEMELCGIGISITKIQALEKKIKSRLVELTTNIHGFAGKEFNINSPRQVAEIIFEKLELGNKYGKKTKTGMRSTGRESLDAMRGLHPIIDKLLEYREDFKILSTYIVPIRERLDEVGRLHTDFVQTGTATGRLSSQSPNLQNIPQESMWSKDLRGAFESKKGFSFVTSDYSQLELRILAAVSGDTNMQRAFREKLDIHKITASRVFKIQPENVTPEKRRLAKTLNFGLSYGMGVSAFAKTSGLSREEAKRFVDGYFEAFPGIREWQEKTKAEARTLGYVETLTGRKRFFPELAYSNAPQIIAEAERAAINHPIQGLEADILKLAMIAIREELEQNGMWRKGARMLLSIHDELLFEVPDDMIEATAQIFRDKMEHIYPLEVPLDVEIYSGKNWGNLTKLV